LPITTNPEWQQLALYAVGAALLLVLIFNIPYAGRVLRSLFSFALLAFCLFVLFQQAPFDPGLARLTTRLGLDNQEVVGKEVRIRMARDGHFWAQVSVNGVERRMLVDSGATVTALSQSTAELASVERGAHLLPVIMRTASGTVQAEPGTVAHLRLGNIEARNLKVVVSPALGNVDVLGMNFLSQLASWRVEDRSLILVPMKSDPE
jgi:aspartyl protease family protein